VTVLPPVRISDGARQPSCSYNQGVRPTIETPSETPAALAVWDFAGLLLTYWCNARCAFCYVNSGPEWRAHVAPETVLAWWRGLDELAAAYGRTMRVHLSGGEPFRDWISLISLIRAARDAGLTPVDKLETNAFWAEDEGLTRARLELLAALGVQRLVVSTDVFHQEYVPIERVRRCVEVARRVFGPGRVIVRWWDFLRDPMVPLPDRPSRAAAYRAALARHKDRLTGRAAETLAPLLPGRPAAAFAGLNCVAETLQSRHVHIDPYGNIFPGTCAGIVLARADTRRIPTIWQDLATNWPRHPILADLVAGGSYALLQRAKNIGYVERPTGYASKCHLCADVRRFLFRNGHGGEALGPAECYA
jgi:hypothetical protein